MTSTRGSGGVRLGGQSELRGLAPVRLDGGSARRFGLGTGLGSSPFGRGKRRWLGQFLHRVFGRRSPLRRLDWVLLAGVLGLSLLGTLLVWAATEPALRQAGADPRTYLMKQLLNVAIGLVLMAAVSMLDYRQIRILAPIVLVVSCLGLLVVLSPLGSVVNGAKSWISLPAGFQIEPSEYAKLAIILISAMILSELRQGETRPRMRAVLLTVACAAVPLALVVAEPDLGVTMLMLALLIGLIALSGIRLRWLAGLAVFGAIGIYAVAKMHLLKAYQVSRLTSFMNPNADPRGTGYSAHQALIAIGSGGAQGSGLFHGQLVAGSFVPEQYTDFIFSVSGEELGFVGSLIILALLGVVLFRALRIAQRADDQFGMLVAAGIAIWFGVQSFINIGMTIGIMPVTGLPLPFVSYGGSAMFADMIAIGILQAVYRRRLVFA
ncbi:MAG TPA: rod shape-determining protein RodA [Streptosporangiaceae bacterium]|nr:rod shape-determining protein RodA [Streptosporangiaceae bacterium]